MRGGTKMDAQATVSRIPRRQSRFLEFARAFGANKAALAGLVVVLILVGLALSADAIAPYSYAIKQNIRGNLAAPSAEHLLGTDGLGRDMLARVLHGAKVSLTMGFIPTLVSLMLGMLLGSLAAYFGGWLDNLIMRLCDMFTCIPAILLALCFVAVLGPGP